MVRNTKNFKRKELKETPKALELLIDVDIEKNFTVKYVPSSIQNCDPKFIM